MVSSGSLKTSLAGATLRIISAVYRGKGIEGRREGRERAAAVGVLGGNIGLNPMNINKKELKICHFLPIFLMILALC